MGTDAVALIGGIRTEGALSDGVFAESVGGTGAGGPVAVSVVDDIIICGRDSTAIFVSSRGAAGGGNLRVTVRNGNVIGGSGNGVGVSFDGGANNSLLNKGFIGTIDGIDGLAIKGTTGNEQIDNFGTITGSVDLGSGRNAFFNALGATFNSGYFVRLGGGMLTNAGTLSLIALTMHEERPYSP